MSSGRVQTGRREAADDYGDALVIGSAGLLRDGPPIFTTQQRD